MIKILNQKNVLSYLITVFFITMAYSLPHAVLTVLLLKKGISISQIMVIQAFYSIAIVFSEVPSGVIADLWSRKKLFITSKLLLVLMFSIILFSNSFYMMCLAWIIYGVAAALDSGTIDSQIILEIKAQRKGMIDKFISIDKNVTTFALIIGSVIGGFCYHFIGEKIYIIGIVFVLIGVFVCWKYYKIDNEMNFGNQSNNNVISQLTESIREFKSNKYLRKLIFLSLFGQLFFQSHYQLWQPFLLYKKVDSNFFTLYYLIFQIVSIISYSMPVNKLNILFSQKKMMLFSIVAFIPLLLLSKISFMYNAAYIVYIFLFFVFEYFVEYSFNKEVRSTYISSLVSLKSTISRISSIIVLLSISLGLNYFSVETIIISYFILSFLLTMYVITSNRSKRS
ncbi:Major Facilitator Superfamily protein [Pilibacter termitis]|uniref:Major Facilitator Superfamily protein n=1 Tax=Pilibacter termitis TaxID=263852 RepID=A0A1T4LJT7_9ENTE|nr:MFS transporter [Pilibacter termitis]SJZ54886.1 Major Facilitator Superfamily protein [Pilibacter termitis]